MDTCYKNLLQEYCQHNEIKLPEYRIKNESGLPHIRKFQVKVRVNGQWYVGRDQCSSKKDAEQSAAKKALKNIVGRTTRSNSIQSLSPLPIPRVKRATIEHFPDEYADIEQFIINMVGSLGGRIKTIWTPNARERYKVEIAGSYRYCDNIKKHHKNSQIYFLVNPVERVYYQKCYYRKCFGFRSSIKTIVDNIEKPARYEKSKKKKSCRKDSCQNCNNCGHAIVCRQCFDQDDW